MMTKIKSVLCGSHSRVAYILLAIAASILVVFAAQPVDLEKKQTGATLSVAETYQTKIQNDLTKIVFGEEAAEQHIEYKISDTAVAAPMPDPTCYGEADSPAELQWLLDAAAPLLEGQELYFSTDTEIFAGSKIHYYMDDTILAITWKEVYERSVFTFSEVKLMHPSQFRRYLAGNEYGSGKLFTTTQMSESVNAVVACNGDYYDYRRRGVTVTNGVVHKATGGALDLCFINKDGDMILEQGKKFETVEEAQAYMDEHDVNFSLAFGPALVKDGEFVCPGSYDLGEVKKDFPRAAICQMGKLHYLFGVSNMEAPYYSTFNIKRFGEYIHQTGCIHAYALDGGQTATVAMNNQLINRVNYGSERLISDIIYFATAKPAEE